MDASIVEQLDFLKWAGGGVAGALTAAVVYLFRRDLTCHGELAKYRLALTRLLDVVSGLMDGERVMLRRPTEHELFDPNFNVNSLFQTAPETRRRQLREQNASRPLVQKDPHIP